MKKPILLSLMLMTLTLLSAQDEYSSFINIAGVNSALFKGATPLLYRIVHTGTYYAYEKTYLGGEVVYNGKLYKGVKLNLNSHLDALIVWDTISKKTIELNKEYVERFSIGHRNFINIKERDESGVMEPAYYEVLYRNSVTLYKRIFKVYNESINQEYISSSRGIIRKFVPTIKYYLKKDSGTFTIKRRGDIFSLYPDMKREMRKHIRNSGIYFSKENMDAALVSILTFVDTKHE